jgi:hypothetical protein
MMREEVVSGSEACFFFSHTVTMVYSQYVRQLHDVPSSQALVLTFGNKHFYSCGVMKNGMRHAVSMAEMRKAYRLVAENLNLGGRILLKVS